MTTKINVFTDSGQMEENQDAFSIAVDAQSAIIVLCDGLGGHDCPKQTAQFVAQEVVKEIQNSQTSLLEKVLKNVNERVIANNYGYSTVVVLKIDYESKRIMYANCGDSRLYIIDKKIEQLTIDNTDENELVDRYGYEKTMASFFRRITSCMGMDAEELHIHSGTKALDMDKDTLIILASDGGWELLENRGELKRIAQLNTVNEKEKYLLEQMKYRKKESDDNITVISVSCFFA